MLLLGPLSLRIALHLGHLFLVFFLYLVNYVFILGVACIWIEFSWLARSKQLLFQVSGRLRFLPHGLAK